MQLPNLENAAVPKRKVVDYLLNANHPEGRGKAAFFQRFGFAPVAWEQLAEVLTAHAANEVVRTEASPFGMRYVVEGSIQAPDGRRSRIRSIWFIDHGGETPHFVTAYPLKEHP